MSTAKIPVSSDDLKQVINQLLQYVDIKTNLENNIKSKKTKPFVSINTYKDEDGYINIMDSSKNEDIEDIILDEEIDQCDIQQQAIETTLSELKHNDKYTWKFGNIRANLFIC